MKTTAQNHTPGALRAAYAVMSARNLPVFKHDAEELAAIIDRETAAPELLAFARTFALWDSKGIIKTLAPYEGNEGGLRSLCNIALALCSPNPAQLERQARKDSHDPWQGGGV